MNQAVDSLVYARTMGLPNPPSSGYAPPSLLAEKRFSPYPMTMVPTPNPLAFIGSSIGYTEIGLLMFVVLLLFGPKKIPELARTIGRVMEELRRASTEFKTQVMAVSEETKEATRVIQDDLSIPRSSTYGGEDENQSLNPYEMDEYQRRLHQDAAENASVSETVIAADAPSLAAPGETPAGEVAAATEIPPVSAPAVPESAAASPAVEPAPESRSNG